jgi:hypothetical protein
MEYSIIFIGLREASLFCASQSHDRNMGIHEISQSKNHCDMRKLKQSGERDSVHPWLFNYSQFQNDVPLITRSL